MKGDEKIATKLKSIGDASKEFVDVMNAIIGKLNRDWEVQIDTGADTQQSYFIASKEDVKLVLRQGDLIPASGRNVAIFTTIVDGEVTTEVIAFNGTSQGEYTP